MLSTVVSFASACEAEDVPKILVLVSLLPELLHTALSSDCSQLQGTVWGARLIPYP